MKLISVNTSQPITVDYRHKKIKTSIFKQPVVGPVLVTKQGLVGDGQADLDNHGGVDKAVYAYSFDHYPYWQKRLNRQTMPFGLFGENLTVAGLNEAIFCLGDQLRIGDALLAITQPRVPCFKLGLRLGDDHAVKLFIQSARTGFYLKVLEEGNIAMDARIALEKPSRDQITVKQLFSAYFLSNTAQDVELLTRALTVAELSGEWRQHIEKRLRNDRG